MKGITRINHIGLRVSNFKEACEFYKELGFKYITGPGGPEPVAIIEHPCGITINLILNANQNHKINQLMDIDTKHTGYTHVALEVDDGQEIIKSLAALGISLSGGPIHHPGGTSFFIRDPDQNVIEFIEFKGLDAFK